MTQSFVECPLCHEPEAAGDMIAGVCLSCADAIAFAQNARRGAIDVTSNRPRWDVEDFIDYLKTNHRTGAVAILRDYLEEDERRLAWKKQVGWR